MTAYDATTAVHHCCSNSIGSIHLEHSQAFQTTDAKSESDKAVLGEVLDWMATRLPCVAGRREFNKRRYQIQIATRETVPEIFSTYQRNVEGGRAVACLFVFNSLQHRDPGTSVFEVFQYLANQMALISPLPAHDLARGAPLTSAMELVCPVTGERTVFDDFECIAFCPQSDNRSDPLYDPLLAMPHPCVNLSSDTFAFSSFVADMADQVLGHPAWQEDDLERLEAFFSDCVARWQRIATMTINRYEGLTDTALCPVHVTKDGQHWIANHKDPAFAEAVKEVHRHELPVLYGARITDGWMQHFRGNKTYTAQGLARDGELLGH